MQENDNRVNTQNKINSITNENGSKCIFIHDNTHYKRNPKLLDIYSKLKSDIPDYCFEDEPHNSSNVITNNNNNDIVNDLVKYILINLECETDCELCKYQLDQ